MSRMKRRAVEERSIDDEAVVACTGDRFKCINVFGEEEEIKSMVIPRSSYVEITFVSS